jgi:hypothetical protein
LFPLFATGVALIPVTNCHGVIDTGGKFAAGVVESAGKFATGVIDAGGVP